MNKNLRLGAPRARNMDFTSGKRRDAKSQTTLSLRCTGVKENEAESAQRGATMRTRCLILVAILMLVGTRPNAQREMTARFTPPTTTLTLSRGITTGAFFDVIGRRSAVFGYEGRPLEAWIYPLKVLDRFQLSFRMEGYPLAVPLSDLPGTIEVRPEATVFTSTHAAFTIRQILFAPINEAAIVLLLDIDTTLPITIVGSFRPALRPMWPAGAPTANIGWDAAAHLYELSEESGKFAAIVGIPSGTDRSVMPYQEEPRDVPFEFTVEVSPAQARASLIPIVITGSMEGRATARAAYTRVLGSIEPLYASTVDHYRQLTEGGTRIATPDERLNTAYDWARVGMEKGFATNPALGTGLVAGFRTSGNSERPGFAWFFGRDALWTSLALTASGRAADARTALAFLAAHQRADGKIPHEISQSAALIPWFTDFPYAWASADATPLFVIAHADAWRAGADRAFLEQQWPSILKAYEFSAKTDTDGNGLIENTHVGHGWVEGGALYPPHEEMYMQGVWIEASRSLAEMAAAIGDVQTATRAQANAERTREAMESTYWLTNASHYAFATVQPRKEPGVAEPGPERERRQRRLNALAQARLIDEDTVLPAVPMWWRTVDTTRAEAQIDRLGSGALATDWGHRILSNRSELYDPLSYHYGSVWPLFTGWASMAAYRYGRPHVGYQGLLATALLTKQGALGYVTELLSGDFNAAFGRSSHHQVWSEAMVVTPLVRGLLGIEPLDGGTRLRVAPQLPANWDRVTVRQAISQGTAIDIDMTRAAGLLTIRVARNGSGPMPALAIAPALPLDAIVESVRIDGRQARPNTQRLGDIQFTEVTVPQPAAQTVVEFRYRGGSDVYAPIAAPEPGARNQGIRILRSRADATALRLLLEGLNGRSYDLFLRSSRQPGTVDGATLVRGTGPDPIIRVSFAGTAGEYTRREVVVRLP
jgi:glycogen debranching enzyme